MKSRLIVVAAYFLVAMPCVASAQLHRTTGANATTEPHSSPQQAIVNTNQPDADISRLFAFQPAIPLGPIDVLKGYEDGMNLIAQQLSADLISIMQANLGNQITRAEAEYLIQERYQVAMMQHEVLSALHDSLQLDLDQTSSRPSRVRQSDTVSPQASAQGERLNLRDE